MSLKDKFSFQDSKDLSSEEIAQQLKNNAFGLSEEDEADFMKFAEAAPGSEERLKILSNRQEQAPGAAPTSPEDVKPPHEVADSDSQELNLDNIDPSDPTAVKAPDKPTPEEKPPAKKTEGDVEEEIVDDEPDIISKLADVTKERDSHRSTNSRLGNENRDLRQQLEESQKKLRESAHAKEPEIVPLEVPIPPLPSDYEEGQYDTKYTEAYTQYTKDLRDYSEKSGETPPKWALDLINKVSDIESKSDRAYNYAETEQENKAGNEYTKAFDSMWEKSIDIQKKLNLPTGKLTPRQINYYILRQNNPQKEDGTPVYPAHEVEGAKNFIKELPKTDYENFTKLSKVVNNYFRFDPETSTPYRASEVADEFLLPDIVKKLGIEVNTVVADPNNPDASVEDLSNQQQNVSDVSASLSESLGNKQTTLNDSTSNETKIQTYNTMAETFRKNPAQCKANAAWMATFNKLDKEMQQLANYGE